MGDDAAVAIPARGQFEVLTTDALVEGVHFDRAFSSLADVGYRAIAVNVSDVAAMGATPRLALLSLILPAGLTVGDVEDLLDGVGQMCREAGIALAGGNLTRSPGPLIVDVTVLGAVRPRKVLTRGGGAPGDFLYVTGTVGAAAAGLSWLRESRNVSAMPEGLGPCVARYRRPSPRTRIGALLGRSRAASACMDLSDGLADAVTQIAAASGTGAAIDGRAIPIPGAARRWFEERDQDPVSAAVSGGDDYELLFSVPRRRLGRLNTVIQQARGVPITRIGELTASPDVTVLRDGTLQRLAGGFTHF
jgi:thiamine-monophosphate kinase